jgi:hypothetical protein
MQRKSKTTNKNLSMIFAFALSFAPVASFAVHPRLSLKQPLMFTWKSDFFRRMLP